MSLLSKLATSIITFVAAVFLLPKFGSYTIGFALRTLGWSIQRRTADRRQAILDRVRVEREDFDSKRDKRTSKSSEDEEWEKVDDAAPGTPPKRKGTEDDWDGIVGFFHPFCNAGGGGERVLWEAVHATQKRWPKATCVIYTGDHEVGKTEMVERVKNRFNIQLHPPTLVLLYLSTRKYVLHSMYPYLTLLGQSLGSLIVVYDAFNLLVPDIFIDTMGYAFTLAFSKLLFPSVPTGAYVHYPTISTDMLESLDDTTGTKGINSGAGTGWRGFAKRKYWLAFAWLYGWVGGKVDVVMCNSSWTSAHIRTLWGPSRKKREHGEPTVIFPPTAVSELESSIEVNSDTEKTREPTILYIAQFRPEKNHPLVLKSFARFLNDRQKNPASASQPTPKLILIGSVRHGSPDETHIYNLRLLAHELRIRDHTTFICDASWPTVLSHLRTSSIGANAMWNEHFGICVVEYQAAGLISVVHDSGGPREDIVVDLGDGATGFRATTEEEFAAAFEAALALPEEEKVAMRQRARKSALRFTEEEFDRKWITEVEKLVTLRTKRTRR
ncbi:CAZyme family GT4 [Paecilomyces variotii]|nr:CAZyme family GT4 [Paecilomyces variotii]KAJ9197779.1 CAZyme family GT4 [Paecilomyces variotii]KAJ9250514.1 CAZyme family GT4 [Paecilomyces variotii]KAJ9273996.1 CAZyme family GT4 [Paecilomyces variotii]KAJ9338938.1 CAZyme family GT4 [Paecilomyces variotii]